MGLTDKIMGMWGTISSGTKKFVRGYGLPLALATAGLYAASCQPPRRDFGNGGGNGGGSGGGNVPLVLSEKTQILGGTGKIISISDDQSILRFQKDSKYAQDLEAGDIIVTGIHDKTPNGLLRKVTAHSTKRNYIEVRTEQATLEDAIEEGILEGPITFTGTIQQPLRRSSAETKEYPLTAKVGGSGSIKLTLDESEIADGVYIGGIINLALRGQFMIDIGLFSLREMRVEFGLNQTARLEGRLHSEIEIDEEKWFDMFALTGTEINFGGFPLVITPAFQIAPYVTAKGALDARAVLTEELTASVGLEYDKNSGDGWEPISEFDLNFGYEEPTLEGCGYGVVGTRLIAGVLIYGVAGPYIGLEGSLKAETAPEEPSTLMAKLKASVGAKVSVLGKNLVDVELPVYHHEKTLWEGPQLCGDSPQECTPNSSRRCEDGNLSQYDSCGELERVIECENGCEAGGRECDGDVGEREGEGEVGSDWVFTRMIEVSVPQAPHQTTINAMAWDNSRLWYLMKTPGLIGANLCALNVGTEETERCFENVSRYERGRPTIAFASGQMYIQEQDFDLVRNGISRISTADGSSEVVYDWPDYHTPVFQRITSFNNVLHGSVYVRGEGVEFCSLLLPDRLTCSDARDTSLSYIVKFSDEEFIKISGQEYEDLVKINGFYAFGEAETFDRVGEEGKCFGQATSLAIVGNSIYVGCERNRILEYRRQ